MTEHLYYNNSRLLTFEGIITETGLSNKVHYLVLDRSAFYPTSGGQQHDTGKINGVGVINVIEREDGSVIHLLEKKEGNIGDLVTGEIDRTRRLRHCQSHTAQHILSAVAFKSFDLKTVSVHLGKEYSAIEFEVPSINEDILLKLEYEANLAIQNNLAVEISFAEGEELKKIPLRRETNRSGTIRIIHISGLDYAACGGTHCLATGEVRLIKIISSEKIRGGTLIKFLSGQQAIDDYINRYTVTEQLSKSLTCNPNDLTEKVHKLNNEKKDLALRLSESQRVLFPVWIKTLAAKKIEINGYTLVMDLLPSAELTIAPQLSSKLANEIDGVVMLLIQGRLFLALADSVPLEAGVLARKLAERNSLKGGGRDRAAQLGEAFPDKIKQYSDSLKGILGEL